MSEQPRIRLLSESLINKIAAGEVLERPASAIKELLENAIDADASRIRVELEDGGRSLLRVTDDGVGMGREDAERALTRHATSKIRTDEDLFAIRTLGFRGEALPSIAEVSRFEMVTGRRGEEAGTRVLVDGGELQRIEDAPNPGGTDIRVRRLFFNTPVRLKFLKTPRTEMTHVLKAVTRIAMAHPHVGFELVSEGRRLLDAPPSDDLAGRLACLLGKAVVRGMHPMAGEGPGLRVEGMIGGSTLHRSNNAGIHLFVNGRYVRERTLVGAVLAAYKPHLPRGRYPVVALFVDVPPAQVDVNVHPAKTEVRFRDARRLYGFLQSRLQRALQGRPARSSEEHLDDLIGAPGRGSPAPVRRAVQGVMPIDMPVAPTFWGGRRAALLDRAPPPSAAVPESAPVEEPRPPRSAQIATPSGAAPPEALRFVAEVAGFWVCEQGEAVVLVDPRRARAVEVRARLEGRLAEPARPRRLLVPLLVDLPAADASLVAAHAPLLAEVAVELAAFGEGTVSLHAVPADVDPDESLPGALARSLRATLGKAPEVRRAGLARVLASRSGPAPPDAADALLAALAPAPELLAEAAAWFEPDEVRRRMR